MKYLDLLGSICMFIAVLCIVAVNVIQDIEISNLEDELSKQTVIIEELEEDVDKLNDVLTGGLELGMFTATYYCA